VNFMICSICKKDKLPEEFYKRAIRCKECYNLNRTPEGGRKAHLNAMYRTNEAEYLQLYAEQEGCCAICKKSFKVLCIDHCHSSGIIRGLLCDKCNRGIGLLGDSISTIKSALEYLEKLRPLNLERRMLLLDQISKRRK
jgi:hypothetical protein